jgi:hypothetical protein
MPAINKWRQDFLIETFWLFLSIKGRINFLQLERHGEYMEQRYRQQFELPFDFLSFNRELVMEHGSGSYVIALDPTYIAKSGKKTPGLGKFWSGQASAVKEGLEIVGIAAIDIDNHTAFHLDAPQTMPRDNQTLPEIYANMLISRKEQLLALTNVVVADAYFSKKAFVNPLLKNEFTFIGRLRKDADLLYLNKEKSTKKRGRPKKYAGKVDPKNINEDYMESVPSQDEAINLCSAIVYSKSFKKKIRIVIMKKTNDTQDTPKIYFCTDTQMAARRIIQNYKSRFQIEFLYRDAKQHTGLNHCQARSENKLNFHFNTALTTLNLAKATHWLKIPKEDRGSFSMNDVKTINHNTLLINRFLVKFGIDPNLAKNHANIQELIYYGTIAA